MQRFITRHTMARLTTMVPYNFHYSHSATQLLMHNMTMKQTRLELVSDCLTVLFLQSILKWQKHEKASVLGENVNIASRTKNHNHDILEDINTKPLIFWHKIINNNNPVLLICLQLMLLLFQ